MKHLDSGDKIVCLKDYTTSYMGSKVNSINFIKNKVYTIDSYHYEGYEGYEYYKIAGEFFLIHFSVQTFDSWFITLRKSRKYKLKSLKYGRAD